MTDYRTNAAESATMRLIKDNERLMAIRLEAMSLMYQVPSYNFVVSEGVIQEVPA